VTNNALTGLMIPLLWVGGMVAVLLIVKLLTKKKPGDDDE
jgi:hypothetical protein